MPQQIKYNRVPSFAHRLKIIRTDQLNPDDRQKQQKYAQTCRPQSYQLLIPIEQLHDLLVKNLYEQKSQQAKRRS